MNMRYYYDRSVEGLKQYIKLYKKIPDNQEWSEFAMQYNLLSCESIKYISGSNFEEWCRNIKKSMGNFDNKNVV